MLFADTSRGRPFAKDPAVVHFLDKYWLYYSITPYNDGREPDGLGIGIATSNDLENWTKVGELELEGDLEKNGIGAPAAWLHNGQLHLFYQTYGNGRRDAICHAISNDGLTFVRNTTNPIVRPTGDWNCGRAIDADVAERDGILYLFWATRDPDFKIQMLGVSAAPIDNLQRENWTQLCDAPILKPELAWEQECIEAPAACVIDGRFYMFYAGAYNNMPQQIGCAVSDDAIHWKRLSDQPILPNGGSNDWNSSESGHPYVFVEDDGTTHLFYQGNNDMGKSWYLARKVVIWNEGMPILV